MNEVIKQAIEALQAANVIAVTAQFNAQEVSRIYDSAMQEENDARALVHKREQELVKAVRENQA